MATKEELTKQLGRAEQTIKNNIEKDDRLKADLSEILGSYKLKTTMGYSSSIKEIIVLSWLQISAEIGKLLTKKRELDDKNEIEHLRINQDNAQRIISELQEKLENK